MSNSFHRPIKVYVGCALTHASPQFIEKVTAFREALDREDHFEVLRFSGLGTFKKGEVYHQDINLCLGAADMFLAIADHPSLGLGFELHEAVKGRGIPTLITHHHSRVVSDLALDLTHHFRQLVMVHQYEHIDDLHAVLPAFIRRHDTLRHLISAWPEIESVVDQSAGLPA